MPRRLSSSPHPRYPDQAHYGLILLPWKGLALMPWKVLDVRDGIGQAGFWLSFTRRRCGSSPPGSDRTAAPTPPPGGSRPFFAAQERIEQRQGPELGQRHV